MEGPAYFIIKFIFICLQIASSSQEDPFAIITNPSSDSDKFKTFASSDSSNYSTITLDESVGTLFIGARDFVFGQNLEDVTQQRFPKVHWLVEEDLMNTCDTLPQSQNGEKCYNLIQVVQPLNDTHLLVCGTNALTPMNRYLVKSNGGQKYSLVDNKDIRSPLCSFDPQDSISSLVNDGNVFSTRRSDLQSKISVSKTMTRGLVECNDNMQEELTNFVATFTKMDRASSPNMQKVYFVSDEKADELGGQGSFSPTITQVCSNDIGGKNILQNEWTSLLKVRLLCQTADKYPLSFDLITHAVLGNDGILYATFTTRHVTGRSNAVCTFRLSDIQNAFNKGNFWEEETISRSYTTVPAPDNSLRPGICAYGGMLKEKPEASTSQDFPASHLTFMREHNVVQGVIKPSYLLPMREGTPPLLIKTVDKFTQIAMEQVNDTNNHKHNIVFVGTEAGYVYKFVSIFQEKMETVELAKYKISKSPIISMKLSSKYNKIYLGTDKAVHQLSTKDCAVYNKTCEFCDPCRMCILSRDPNCAWNEKKCVYIKDVKDPSTLLQDVMHGDAVTQCPHSIKPHPPINKGVEDGATEILGHVVENPVITATWYKEKNKNSRQKVPENSKYRITKDGQLEISKFDPDTDSATYKCEYRVKSALVAEVDYNVRSSRLVSTTKKVTLPNTVTPVTPVITKSTTSTAIPNSTHFITGTTGTPGTGEINVGSTSSIVIGISIVLVFILMILIAVMIYLKCCRKCSKGTLHNKKNEHREETNRSQLMDGDNTTNNNNASIEPRRIESVRNEAAPLIGNIVTDSGETGSAENEHLIGVPQAPRSKSCDPLNSDGFSYIDEQEGHNEARSAINLDHSSSLREDGGRKRVPPSRTKSMPGSSLYVVYAGKKFACSTLQRKQGNLVIVLEGNQSGMSDMPGEDEIIAIENDESQAFSEDSNKEDPSAKSSEGYPATFSPHPSKTTTKNNSLRKAFFDDKNPPGDNASAHINYATSTPQNAASRPIPDFENRKKHMKTKPTPQNRNVNEKVPDFENRKKPYKPSEPNFENRKKSRDNSKNSLRSIGQNSSEDSDSTVQGSSSTLKQEDTPKSKNPFHHHRNQKGAFSQVPTTVPTSDMYSSNSPSVGKTRPSIRKCPSNRSLDNSSGSSGDEQLHGRDKNVSRKPSYRVPDSPSKESHSSSSSASSSDYRSARSSVISEQNHDQKI